MTNIDKSNKSTPNNSKKEKVKLDIILKFLFTTSEKVLINLLNGVFGETFNVDEVNLSISNNEFVDSELGIIRGEYCDQNII